MKRFSVLVLSLALVLAAVTLAGPQDDKGAAKPTDRRAQKVDVSGKWSGTLEFKNAEGETKSGSAYMILKQDGDKLTGSGGPSEGEQHPIRNGKVEGDRLTFEAMESDNPMVFDLTVNGDQITGEIKASQKEGKTHTAKLSLKRVAEK